MVGEAVTMAAMLEAIIKYVPVVNCRSENQQKGSVQSHMLERLRQDIQDLILFFEDIEEDLTYYDPANFIDNDGRIPDIERYVQLVRFPEDSEAPLTQERVDNAFKE